LGTKGQHATSRPPKPPRGAVHKFNFIIVLKKIFNKWLPKFRNPGRILKKKEKYNFSGDRKN
jgi:hypothetical protein